MSAPTMPGLVCAAPGCQGKYCARAGHKWLGGDRYGPCATHRRCTGFELDELAALVVGVSTDVHAPAEPEPTDSPAGAVDEAGTGPVDPLDDLPGTSPAPVWTGHEAADPVRGGEAEHPTVEALTPASTAGQLLGSYVTWWCARHLEGAELPSAHGDCGTRLVRARVTIRREPEDG